MASIAVDIGASSGRLIAGWLEGNILRTKEIHRFPNGAEYKNGHFYWDINRIYNEIMIGLSKADFPFKSVGVDTWGVDYALLNEKGELVSDVFSYRDHRTDGLPETIDQSFLYKKTGIQTAQYNTIYQLIAHKNKNAARFLTIPDYLHYKLSGKMACEYTIATTTQLINISTGNWDDELIEMTGFKRGIFPEIVQAGTKIGYMKEYPEAAVILPASHDTASAVASVPAATGDFAYISSGTWSLMGAQMNAPYMQNPSFTNEGGVFGTYRVLKNIMGLWVLQEVRRLLGGKPSFEELAAMAEAPFGSTVDVNNLRFLNPSDMIGEIRLACRESFQKPPETTAEIARCIFDSLALSYQKTYGEILSFADVKGLYIVGGGSQNMLLNRLTAEKCKTDIFAGPVEATAAGNLVIQMISLGEIKNINEGRSIIAESFKVKKIKKGVEK
ncbi:MAG: rhamnulokinase [Clostridiales bacterium]|jgi:rhamnulokinase|nr:rhamnulokinase [Clostridiales bacterium]